jgi:endonuclease/exonuclease/phosphatase family metal-dependent hydrolase
MLRPGWLASAGVAQLFSRRRRRPEFVAEMSPTRPLVRSRFLAAGIAAGLSCAAPAAAQIRLAQWNITSYAAGQRTADFQTAFYAVNSANGLSMRPDIIVIQELVQGGFPPAGTQATGQTNLNAFLSMLNTAPGSPGDWAAATYVRNTGDTGNALLYRTSKIQLLDTITLSNGTGGSGPPRDNQRWRVRLFGYTGTPAELYLYGAHMKAGADATTDQPRRQAEALRIRTGTIAGSNPAVNGSTNTLPAGARFVLCGDFNTQSANQAAYQTLITVGNAASGQLFDPITSPGAWNSNPTAWRYILTQEQTSNMDDRLDFILISSALRSGQGMSYMPGVPGGNIFAAYSTSTWNDPNHSYRSWGNDGSRVNLSIATTTNAMVGQAIAQALINSAAGNGHLPVFLDLRVPSRLGTTPATINFGSVAQGSPASVLLTIANTTDTGRFNVSGRSDAIDPLTYTLAPSAGFGAPGGSFNLPAGAPDASHAITMDTSTLGPKAGTLTITSDDGNGPTRTIALVGTVVPGGPTADYDVNDDGLENVEDVYAWMAAPTDVNLNATIDEQDLADLLAYLRTGEVPSTTAGRR